MKEKFVSISLRNRWNRETSDMLMNCLNGRDLLWIWIEHEQYIKNLYLSRWSCTKFLFLKHLADARHKLFLHRKIRNIDWLLKKKEEWIYETNVCDNCNSFTEFVLEVRQRSRYNGISWCFFTLMRHGFIYRRTLMSKTTEFGTTLIPMSFKKPDCTHRKLEYGLQLVTQELLVLSSSQRQLL